MRTSRWPIRNGPGAADGQRPADVLTIKRSGIRDGALWVVQNKTGARIGIEVTGELARSWSESTAARAQRFRMTMGNRCRSPPYELGSIRLERAAGVNFQFRDLRAKAATDTGDLSHSQAPSA